MTSPSEDNFKSQVFCKIQGASWLCTHKNPMSPWGFSFGLKEPNVREGKWFANLLFRTQFSQQSNTAWKPGYSTVLGCTEDGSVSSSCLTCHNDWHFLILSWK